eukprot:2562416-Pleurochrysis_carterae.AAC.1
MVCAQSESARNSVPPSFTYEVVSAAKICYTAGSGVQELSTFAGSFAHVQTFWQVCELQLKKLDEFLVCRRCCK